MYENMQEKLQPCTGQTSGSAQNPPVLRIFAASLREVVIILLHRPVKPLKAFPRLCFNQSGLKAGRAQPPTGSGVQDPRSGCSANCHSRQLRAFRGTLPQTGSLLGGARMGCGAHHGHPTQVGLPAQQLLGKDGENGPPRSSPTGKAVTHGDMARGLDRTWSTSCLETPRPGQSIINSVWGSPGKVRNKCV